MDVSTLESIDDIYHAVHTAASSGLGVIPRISHIGSTVYGTTMDPIITDFEFNETLQDRIVDIADTLRNTVPVAYSLGRDNMLTPFEIDVSFSQTDIESFRLYLESKYETVNALNQAWGTTLVSFNDAQPMPLSEAESSGYLPIWLDTRLHMEEVFTQVHYEATDIFEVNTPGVRVGIEGFDNAWSPYRGYNLFELTGFFSMAVAGQSAGPGLPGDVSIAASLASMTRTGSLTGLSTGGEYYRRGNEALLRAVPWQSLFGDINGVWWLSAWGGTDGALTPQLTLAPAFSVVADEANEIMGGIDLLLRGNVQHFDKIGILYSPVSKMASVATISTENRIKSAASSGRDNTAGNSVSGLTPEPDAQTLAGSARGFYLACRDAGYSPIFIADDQLTDDWLAENKFNILLLPYVQAISDETAQVIESFVSSGGTLIADMRTGIMNEHLRMRDSGALDDVFGVSLNMNRFAVRSAGPFTPRELDGGLPPDCVLNTCFADPTVKAQEGVAVLADVQGAPAVIINRYGDGITVYLNMGMDMYETLRNTNDESSFRNIVSWCLKSGGFGDPYCCP
ncbi:beta-galactosidase trimerization domain-containing protein [Candidatus Latescibacterota bacterium]